LENIPQLEVEIRAESPSLEHKIDKENREHAIDVVKLQKKLEEVTLEFEDLRNCAESEDLDHEIDEPKASLANFQCREYQQELKAFAGRRVDLEDALEQIRNRQKGVIVTQLPELEALKSRIGTTESSRVALKSQITDLEVRNRLRKKESDEAIAAMEQKHKEQIAAIGERVKQTLAKKDRVIEQLKDKLRECGMIS
jgi:predicted  nucleic acid-binding Zn-ribbon protein